jgi:hypothetical protein
MLQSYLEELRKTIESSLSLLADNMTLQFTQTTEDLSSVNASLQEQINTITKYFTFSIDGLIIGASDSQYKVIVDNDRYSMNVNDVEIMWIANGEVHTPEISIERRISALGYLIDLDDYGNVNCGYVGGEE